jgi:hypothetical protein
MVVSLCFRSIAEPYIRMYWGTEITVRAIISLAISVWNMTFLPQDEQIALQEKLIEEILPKDCNAADVATMHRIFDELQDRQRGLFPNLRKLIVGHDLRLDGKNIHLDISSLPLGEVAQKE